MKTSGSKNEVVAEIPSGVKRMAPLILAGWTILTAIYVTLLAYFRDSSSILFLPSPADEFCADVSKNELCNRVDLFTFQVASGIALTTCGIIGFVIWHVTKRVHTQLPSTPEGRLFGYLPESELLAAINFTFQSWDFFVSLTIPEHATAIMLAHHIMAATVSWCSIRYTYLHYYGVFFLGLTEVSSIFLIYVDLAKYFPPVPGTFYQQWVEYFTAPLFVICFLYYRVVLWWPESLRLFNDVRSVVASGRAQQLRPGATWVLYLFLALNLPLGLLQLYWVTVIFEEARKALAA